MPAFTCFNEAAALLPRKRRGLQQSAAGQRAALASMRPRHYCRGRGVSGRERRKTRRGFNEAAALLPRKRGMSELREQIAAECFNEAAALLPRKRIAADSAPAIDFGASMRPRHYCRGRGRW